MEYDSGSESREAINSRIEPYPGDLTKVRAVFKGMRLVK